MTAITKSAKKNAVLLIIIAALAVALIAVMIIIFSPKPQDNTAYDPTAKTNIPSITLETPYCTLKYPEQWKDQMTVEESVINGCLSETFYAVIAGSQYKLFTVCFGNSPAGELFGYLPGDEAAIPVYIECHGITGEIGLSESELTLFYSMMEGVNEVAKSISAVPGYSAP